MVSRAFISATLAVIIAIGVISTGLFVWYQFEQDINAPFDRAQVAGDAGDMNEYLHELRDGMDKHGFTDGHYALIFKTPWNDVSRDYDVINHAIDRSERLIGLDRSSTAYQTGMDDLRGFIRELSWSPFKWWNYNTLTGGLWLFMALIGWWLIPAAYHFGGNWVRNNG